jgi:threonine/homoserine/homoserine lactone efflux protein
VLNEPGAAFAVLALVLSAILPPAGLILSVSSYREAKKRRLPGTIAWWGIWVGAIFTVLIVFAGVGSLIGGLLAR